MNRSLGLGIIGTMLLLLAIVFGPALAPYTMDEFKTFHKVWDPKQGKEVMVTPPLPPSEDHPLGTDMDGRDMLSILLRGARVTVTFAVFVAIVRLLIGLPLAYAGSMFKRTVGWLNEKLSLAFTTVPAVLILSLVSVIFVMSDAFSSRQILMIMACLIAAVGLFPTAYVLQTKLDAVQKLPFMEGQAAIGAGRWRILRKHLLPHLSAYLAVLFVSEIAQTLWLIGQLGVLNIFIGGTIVDQRIFMMRIPEEWAGTIGHNLRGFNSHPMMVLYPVLALSFAILSFNLLADGIRKWNERRWGIGG
jgi:peptide/nickel transport system permease protein